MEQQRHRLAERQPEGAALIKVRSNADEVIVPGFPRHTQNLGASRRKARRGER